MISVQNHLLQLSGNNPSKKSIESARYMIVQRTITIKLFLFVFLVSWSHLLFAQSSTHTTYESKRQDQTRSDKKKKKHAFSYPESHKKSRYRIDIMIPLYLDELVQDNKLTFTGKIPEKAQTGVNFYQGIKLAVDTLNSMGYTTDIYIHDISATTSSIEQLIVTDSLRSSDLIIGFVPAQQVSALATYAAEKQINFVSAFSPSDASIQENPYFILLNPTLQSNCASIVASVLKLRDKERVLVYKHNNVSIDSTAFHYIVDQANGLDYTEVDCSQLPDSTLLASKLDSTNMNIIVIPVMDVTYAEKLVQQLHKSFPKYEFEIFGMPSWKSITTNRKMIDWGAHIAINITQAYYIDPTVSAGQLLATAYRSTYGSQPNEIAFRGYELVYWMTDLLQKYGPVFNEKMEDNGMAIFTRFDLKPKIDKEQQLQYIENKHLYLYHYQAGTVLVQQ